MAKDAKPVVGTVFTVKKQHEFRDRDELVARYIPGQTYRVTDRNRNFVATLDDVELVSATRAEPSKLAASEGKVRGAVDTGPAPTRKARR